MVTFEYDDQCYRCMKHSHAPKNQFPGLWWYMVLTEHTEDGRAKMGSENAVLCPDCANAVLEFMEDGPVSEVDEVGLRALLEECLPEIERLADMGGFDEKPPPERLTRLIDDVRAAVSFPLAPGASDSPQPDTAPDEPLAIDQTQKSRPRKA